MTKLAVSSSGLRNCGCYCCLVAQSCLTLAIPWTVACQAPLSTEFSRQEYWSGLPFPNPGNLPDPGIESAPPTLAGGLFTTEPPGNPPRCPSSFQLRGQQPLVATWQLRGAQEGLGEGFSWGPGSGLGLDYGWAWLLGQENLALGPGQLLWVGPPMSDQPHTFLKLSLPEGCFPRPGRNQCVNKIAGGWDLGQLSSQMLWGSPRHLPLGGRTHVLWEFEGALNWF